MKFSNGRDERFGRGLLRWLTGLLAALLLLGMPLPGDENGGGEGGIVILPGANSLKNGLRNRTVARMQVVRSETLDGVTLQLPAEMDGAIGICSVDGNGNECIGTSGGFCVLPGDRLAQLQGAGVRVLRILFVNAQQLVLDVEVVFDTDGDGFTVIVW